MGIGNSQLGRLDANELKILKSSWQDVMKNASENGAYIFGRFLRSYNYISYFKKLQGVSLENIDQNPTFKRHSSLIMTAIDNIILHSNSDEELLKELHKIGKMHANKNLTSQQFLELKGIITDTMDEKFHLPTETLKIWNKAFDIGYFYVFQALESKQGTSSVRN